MNFDKLTTTFSSDFVRAINQVDGFRKQPGVRTAVTLLNRLAIDTCLCRDVPECFLSSDIWYNFRVDTQRISLGFELAARVECRLELVDPFDSSKSKVIAADVRFYGKGQDDLLLHYLILFRQEVEKLVFLTLKHHSVGFQKAWKDVEGQ